MAYIGEPIPSQILPQSDPPLLIWASTANCGYWQCNVQTTGSGLGWTSEVRHRAMSVMYIWALCGRHSDCS